MKLLLFAAMMAVAQDDAPDLAHVMEMVRGHVARLETSVPNFICDEKIVSTLYRGNNRKKETRAEDLLTTTRRLKEHSATFQEARSDMKIDGKPSKRKEISGPFVWQGGPAYADLHFLFNSPKGNICLERKLVGPVKLRNADAILIEAHTSDALGRDAACEVLRADSEHRIWLDPQSLNVMRIESYNPPTNTPPDADVTLTVDYVPVTFEGAEYWLPSHFTSKLDLLNASEHARYESSFSNYHQFSAESTVHIDSDQ